MDILNERDDMDIHPYDWRALKAVSIYQKKVAIYQEGKENFPELIYHKADFLMGG